MTEVTLEQLNELKNQLVMLVASNQSGNGNSNQNQAVLDLVKNTQKMDMILMLAELMNIENLDYVTEHTSMTFVKQITKLETLRAHQAEHFDFEINDKWDSDSMQKDQDKIIKPMVRYWKLNMTSKNRKRVQEIIQGLKQEAVNYNIGNVDGKKKKFLGVF